MKKIIAFALVPAALGAVFLSSAPQDANAANIIVRDGHFDIYQCNDGTQFGCGLADGTQVHCTESEFGYAASVYCADHGGVASPGIVSGVLVNEAVEDDVAEDEGQDIEEAPSRR